MHLKFHRTVLSAPSLPSELAAFRAQDFQEAKLITQT